MSDKKDYKDERFNSLSAKLGGLIRKVENQKKNDQVSNTRSNKSEFQDYSNKMSRENSVRRVVRNEQEEDVDKSILNQYDKERYYGGQQEVLQTTSTLNYQLESKVDDLEEQSFKVIKDQELKVNLLQEEVNYLIKAIGLEKEMSDEIKTKIGYELKNCEKKVNELIESNYNDMQLSVVSLFASLEKRIDSMLNENKLSCGDQISIDDCKAKIDMGLNNIRLNLNNEEVLASKEVPIMVGHVNQTLKMLSDEINRELSFRENQENNILIEIESNLKSVKQDFSEIKQSREIYEQRLIEELEKACTHLVHKFQSQAEEE